MLVLRFKVQLERLLTFSGIIKHILYTVGLEISLQLQPLYRGLFV